VRTKDSCWYVGTIYDPRELPGVSTAGPGIGWGVTIGRALQGLVSLWEGPWCPRALRNKLMLPYPPLRPSMLPQDSVARNYFG
jgi:hypothetical protein